ncbi:MAG TPA: DUF1963 domain-containing protein [Ktedonobacteraceae bacterium]|nr:DUF1963 domain-containing protein [Ktedonobacteraceae bacterium]
MRSKYSLTFREVQQPITQPVTKFGGQPTWLTGPQWPISRSTEEPMQFICQIALNSDIFGKTPGRMAYLFITDDEYGMADTFAPDDEENAVVIQPGTCDMPTQPLLTGPALYKMVDDPSKNERAPLNCEFAVEVSHGEDPELMVEDEQASDSDDDWEEFPIENKIGGTPAFLQGPEFPGEGNWQLLLQIDSTSVPFYVNFGDAGVGYAFLAEDGTSGKFLWQCA